jgi:hypothetical protein
MKLKNQNALLTQVFIESMLFTSPFLERRRNTMKRIFSTLTVFLIFVSVMALYPPYKWGHSYSTTWWIVARAIAFPFLVVAIRIATERNPSRGLKYFLGITYYGSVLSVGFWFLGLRYPFPETFSLMVFGLFPFIFWGNRQQDENDLDTDPPHLRVL